MSGYGQAPDDRKQRVALQHQDQADPEAQPALRAGGGGRPQGGRDRRVDPGQLLDDQDAIEWFVEEGWQAGAQADAAAKHEDEGDALALAFDVAPGVYLYQMTESGLAAQATIQGTKYWADDDLN